MGCSPSQKRLGLLGAFGLYLVIVYLDSATPWEVGFSAFYLVTVLLASLFGGLGWGLGFGLLATGSIFLTDLLGGKPYTHPFYRYWDLVNHLLVNLLLPPVLHGLQRSLARARRDLEAARAEGRDPEDGDPSRGQP